MPTRTQTTITVTVSPDTFVDEARTQPFAQLAIDGPSGSFDWGGGRDQILSLVSFLYNFKVVDPDGIKYTIVRMDRND